MKFDDLLSKLGKQPFFDLPSVVQLTDEPRKSVQVQLYRWCNAGKLIPLRRGMYCFAEPYASQSINGAQLANHIYRPSYLSTFWALGYYGLIPEKVVTFTSVSSRVTRKFENALGLFTYRHLKADAFWGYGRLEIGGRRVLIAEPEKALLDLWYLENGPWTPERMDGMRFQNMEQVDDSLLQAYGERLESLRILSAIDEWRLAREREEKGTVEL